MKNNLNMDNIKELIEEMNRLRQVKDVVNDSEECCPNLMGKIADMVKENPNDYDLGNTVRKFYLNSLK